MKRAVILGSGSYLPGNIVDNHEISKKVDTSDEWIFNRTGIRTRFFVDGESIDDLAFMASERALKDAGVPASKIDLVIVATSTAGRNFPSVAAVLQSRIKADKAAAVDIQVACAGFVYGMASADAFIRSGIYRTILLVGAEVMSSIMNWQDRSTCVLFGDGAGAVVVSVSDREGIIDNILGCDGSKSELLKADPLLSMDGRSVFKFATKMMTKMVKDITTRNCLKISDLSFLIPHQANVRILNSCMESLGMSREKVIITVSEHANTSSASIPLAFDLSVKENKIKRGDVIVMEAVGGGFTWGANLLIY